MEFNDVFINVKRSWPSGANNAEILAEAQKCYRKEMKKLLKNIAFWLVVKDTKNGFNFKHCKISKVVQKYSKHLNTFIAYFVMAVLG